MELTINGKLYTYAEKDFPKTLPNLLQLLNLAELSIVAEIDGTIINKNNFSSTTLQDGMKIELVKFVGGG